MTTVTETAADLPAVTPTDAAVETIEPGNFHLVDEPMYGKIPMAIVQVGEYQPRQTFHKETLQELAQSIKDHGMKQPILFRPAPGNPEMLQIVAGERRFRAAIIAGLTEVPGMVENMTDEEVATFQLVENMQREDVAPLEEAKGIARLRDEFGMSIDVIGQKIGKKRGVIYASLKLLDLSPDAQAIVIENNLPASTALLVARMPVPALQEKALEEIAENRGEGTPMSNRAAKQLLEDRYMLKLERAPFGLSDAKLCSGAGSCDACPKRTSNSPEDFPDTDSDLCTDPDCFEMKVQAYDLALVAQAKKKKLPVYDNVAQPDKDDAGTQLATTETGLWGFDRLKNDAPRYKSIKDVLLPAALPPHAALWINDDGKPVKVYDHAALQTALETAGFAMTETEAAEAVAVSAAQHSGEQNKVKEKQNEQQRIQKHQQLVAEKETKYRQELLSLIHTANMTRPDLPALLRFVTKMFLEGWSPREYWRKTYGMPQGNPAKQHKFVDDSSDEVVRSLLLDLAMSELDDVSYWQIDSKTFKPESDDGALAELEAFGALCGIDMEELRAAHPLPAYEKPDAAKKKPTEKKKAKPAPKSKTKTVDAAPAPAASTVSDAAAADQAPAAAFANSAWPFPTGTKEDA